MLNLACQAQVNFCRIPHLRRLHLHFVASSEQLSIALPVQKAAFASNNGLSNGVLWPPAGAQEASKDQLLQQLQHLNANYNGGLEAYIRNARKLLQDAQAGASESLQALTVFPGEHHFQNRGCTSASQTLTGSHEGSNPDHKLSVHALLHSH